MDYTFRAGVPSDGHACARIMTAWDAEMPWMAPLDDLEPMAAFRAGMIETCPSWVAECDGVVVGVCLRDDDTIAGLDVAREARGQGIGKRRLDRAKAGCDGLVVWACEANPAARRFYRREGFVEVGRELEESAQLINVEHRWTGPK